MFPRCLKVLCICHVMLALETDAWSSWNPCGGILALGLQCDLFEQGNTCSALTSSSYWFRFISSCAMVLHLPERRRKFQGVVTVSMARQVRRQGAKTHGSQHSKSFGMTIERLTAWKFDEVSVQCLRWSR